LLIYKIISPVEITQRFTNEERKYPRQTKTPDYAVYEREIYRNLYFQTANWCKFRSNTLIDGLMKKTLFLIILTVFALNSFAAHITGGEMIYRYIGPGAAANTKRYSITLKLFRDDATDGAIMPTSAYIGIFSNDNRAQYPSAGSFFDVPITNGTGGSNVPVTVPPVCMKNPGPLSYRVGEFQFFVDLPDNNFGYTVAYQTCCRINSLRNVATSTAPGQGEGSTYSCNITGLNNLPPGEVNSSPAFTTLLSRICYSSPFDFDFSANDPDGDSLVYSFCNAYNKGNAPNATNVNPSTPPYTSVVYINGYSGASPLGPTATIDPKTGIISGIAPALTGQYVVCVCIAEYRNGRLISNHRKDFILNIRNCEIPDAQLNPRATTCDGFTVNFENNGSNADVETWDWEYGDGNTGTGQAPSHTYAAAGDYTVKLVVNRGLDCADSSTVLVKVYPGFRPDFKIDGQCKNTPIQFTDLTSADFGVVNNWSWNFGDPISGSLNTSLQQNPTHNFVNSSDYDVTFIVKTSVGCIDTIVKRLSVLDRPAFDLSNDTLICNIDTLQLHVGGTGSVLWSPNYMIDNVNSFNPLVSPDVTTTYHVQFTDPFGCVGGDTVRVNVVNRVTQFANPSDTTICLTDAITLNLVSDALYYTWTPDDGSISSTTIRTPVVRPLVTTTYHVTGSIGKCTAENDIRVKPVPYPDADAGPDQTICLGSSAQLQASGGSSYTWSPTAFLSASNISNPRSVRPSSSVRYIVTVRDILGCPKPARDTIVLTVANIIADAGPRDTAVVIGQPLQLFATGSTNFEWAPSIWLNDPLLQNPVAMPQTNIEYVVRVSNSIGCFDTDSIRVRVFTVKPDLFVPSAFTPNGDGNNDVFRPIAIGMKSVDLFRIYNRWGQLVYSNPDTNAGWDGTFGGRGQETATYVWYAEGVDYLNNKIKKKGYVVLIR